MNDVQQLCDQLDRLDTGLPERPDVHALVAAGRRRRRHRRLAVTAGVGVAAVVVAVPFAVAGLRTTPSHDTSVATEPPSAYVAPTAPPHGPVSPQFGDVVRAAVSHSVPAARFDHETLADGFAKATVDGKTVFEWSVHTPPTWSSLFVWEQDYTLDSGAALKVTSSRTMPEVTAVSDDFQKCDLQATEVSCESSTVPGGRMLVHDGLQRDATDVWYRVVSLVDPSATRGMMASVEVSASVHAATWDEAQALLPPASALTELAQNPALVLPAPETYPPFPQG